ncbi:MAG: shikimate dehydrogenase [Trueperaceae bacterium]|nr:MAG: shikimate dehydrogenase [Trueperaceae bacterium]
MKRVYLLAYPAGHSVSPAMQNAAFAERGLDVRYEALEVPPAELPEVVARFRGNEVLGANVTIPHKLAVMPLLDELTAAAQAIGAVNTIVNRDGYLVGHNTDADGFSRALADLASDPSGRTALLLGAGGAARAVAFALLSSGVARLDIYNRTQERARALAGDFQALGWIEVVTSEELPDSVSSADLLVNSTSVGMEQGGVTEDISPLPVGVVPSGVVVDLVYRPPETRLLREARVAGCLTQNGLPMLIYQGAEAFKLWTSQSAPVEVMFRAARDQLVPR